MKDKTKHLGIRKLADAPLLVVPLQQHIGRPAEPVVKAGDHVLKYQLIGKAAAGLSANVHSPVSGTVREVGTSVSAGGTTVPAIYIDNDFKEETCCPFTSEALSGNVIETIRQAGIVGEGGAQFPTDVKYSVGEQRIHTLILNGTECEPYLTADYSLMKEHADELLEGILIVNSVIKADDVVIVVERHNLDLRGVFSRLFEQDKYRGIRLQILPDTYPQGGELQVIRSVTGMELPRTTLPKDAGVIVSNVGTVVSIFRAVKRHIPLVSRVLTVSGEKSANYGNYEVKIGTPVSHIIETLGLNADDAVLVMGGPMMGKPVHDINSPVMKGTSGLLLLNHKTGEEGHCISCGYCVEACPMHLMPMQFVRLLEQDRVKRLCDYNLMTCIECAACEYACPAGVPIVRSIKEGKGKLKELSNAAK